MSKALTLVDKQAAHSSASPSTSSAAEIDPISLMEAMLFSGGAPIPIELMMELGGFDEEMIVRGVAQLNQKYFQQGRPYEVRRGGAAYRMVLRPQFAGVLRRLQGRAREVRLSVAAIEVLAIVAYRQPVTLPSIDATRGVESAPIVRQLCRRNLIEPAESDAENNRSSAWRTTKRFLQLFHLKTLDDLPRVQELDKT